MSELRVFHTGIRSGELITSSPSGKQCRGTVLEVRGNYPPSRTGLDSLIDVDFRDRFNNFKFFTKMSPDERKTWLYSHATDHPDLYLEDSNLEVRFLKIGGDWFTEKLTPEQINLLLDQQFRPLSGVVKMPQYVERAGGSRGLRGGKKTLVFRPNNWVLVENTQPAQHDGLVVDLSQSLIGIGLVEGGNLFVIPDTNPFRTSLAILSSSGAPLSYQRIKNLICLTYGFDGTMLDAIKETIAWWSPSVYKSAIQKIIRTRAKEWIVPASEEIKYPAREMLATCLMCLLVHPGAFVPDIQRFVSGAESALKRLAVSICEDSSLTTSVSRNNVEDGSEITLLLAAAWLAQNHQDQTYSDAIILSWFEVAFRALDSEQIYEYDWRTSTNQITEWIPWALSYFLLNELRSFGSDIQMVSSINDHHGETKTLISQQQIPENLYFTHFLDHHSHPEVAHFLPYLKGVEYSEIFSRLWNESSAYNPRKKPNSFFPPGDLQTAQVRLWIAMTHNPELIHSTGPSRKILYHLGESWLTALVGPQEFSLSTRTPVLAMINPDDLFVYSAIRRPSREADKSPELTEAERDEAQNRLASLLTVGINLKIPKCLESVIPSAQVILRNDEYLIHTAGGEIPWSILVNLEMKFPTFELPEMKITDTDVYLDEALLSQRDGIELHADDRLREYLEFLPLPILQRAITYFGVRNQELAPYSISRDGTGIDYTVKPEDTGYFHLLAAISVLYPKALTRHKTTFTITHGPLMWYVIDIIREFVRNKTNLPTPTVWPQLIQDPRGLWDHQQEAIARITESFQHKPGEIVWIPPGMGKCLAPETPVLMYVSGPNQPRMKFAKDVQPGDLLLGDDSEPRYVKSVCHGTDQMYAIGQYGGAGYEVNEPHILTLKYPKHKTYEWHPENRAYRLQYFDRNTLKAYESLITGETRSEATLNLVKILASIPESDVFDISVKDFLTLPKETQDEFHRCGADVEYRETYVSAPYELGGTLPVLGRIPDICLFNSRRIRLEFLAGFLDVNGTVENGVYTYISESRDLLEDLEYLGQSLGLRCELDGDFISIENGKWTIPSRKYTLPYAPLEDKPITVVPLGPGEYYGFELSGNGRFLLGDFTITHNTAIALHSIGNLITAQTMPEYCVYTLPPSAQATVEREMDLLGIQHVHIDMRKAGKHQILEPGKINLVYHDHLKMNGLDEQLKTVATQTFFIIDEFHKTLNKTKRTSLALEISRLSRFFLAMTGTLIKDTNVEDLIEWLGMVVDFEVTPKNYPVAISSIISRKVETRIVVERDVIDAPMLPTEREEYLRCIPAKLGGTAPKINFKRAVDISYDAITRELVEQAVAYVNAGVGVFLVARNAAHQTVLSTALAARGITRIYLISHDHSLSLTPSDPQLYDVVITTTHHSEGYNMTLYMVMITGVYFTNEATREQLEHRINRIDQNADRIRIVIVHSGIISYIHQKYEHVRSIAAAMKGFAKDVGEAGVDWE